MITEATRAKLRAAKLGRPGNPSPWKGKKLSAEHKAALSAGQRRRMSRPGERERLAALARAPAKRESQRQFALELAQRPYRRSELEKRFGALLDAAGVEYSVQFRTERHAFDFKLGAAPVLIEVDGCYWHGCKDCGHPGVAKTRQLDAEKSAWASAAGYVLIRVKEHQL